MQVGIRNLHIFVVFFVFLISGCAILPKTNPPLNPALQQQHFQSAFKTRKILLVAPGSAVAPEANKTLQSLPGLKITAAENLVSDAIIFHANTDEERFLVLKKALNDDSPDTIIWALRGGYGSARLIDRLKKLPKPKYEKLFIGYSDMTALHLFLTQNWGWKTIHGSALIELLSTNKEPENFERIADIVEQRKATLKLDHLKPLNIKAAKIKKIVSRLTGGNLTMVQISIGTDWQIKSANKILFLEDINLKGYQIDRTLYHLKQAAIFKHVKAIIFGNFSDGDDYVELALKRFAAENNIPVFKSEKFGHGKINYPLIYNARTEIFSNPEAEDFSLRICYN